MADVPEFELPDGTVRKLGNNPTDGRLKAVWRVYGDVPDQKMFARSEWPAEVAKYDAGPDFPFLPPVHDQDGVGQCNADSTTAMLESCRMEQGLPYVQLSAADLYDRINGGGDNGSLLEDALREVLNAGVGTAATCGTVWRRGNPRASADERARYRAIELVWCPTFAHCFSAVLSGFRLSTGIVWFDNYNPDKDGWLPGGRGEVGGHAIMGYKPAMRGNTFGIWHQNSWSPRYGLQGRMCIPEGAYRGPVGGWWALRSVTDEGGIIPEERP